MTSVLTELPSTETVDRMREVVHIVAPCPETRAFGMGLQGMFQIEISELAAKRNQPQNWMDINDRRTRRGSMSGKIVHSWMNVNAERQTAFPIYLALESAQDRVRREFERFACRGLTQKNGFAASAVLHDAIQRLEEYAETAGFERLGLAAMEVRLVLIDGRLPKWDDAKLTALRQAIGELLVTEPTASDPSACWQALRSGGLNWIPDLSKPDAHEHPAVGKDWSKINARRIELIHKNVYSTLSPLEAEELEALQRFTDSRMQLLCPLPISQLEAIRDDLRRRGMWEGD